jgi:hypothetical protein
MAKFTSNKTIIVVGVLILITVLSGLFMLAAIELKESAQHDQPHIISSSPSNKDHASKRRSSTADTSSKGQAQ